MGSVYRLSEVDLAQVSSDIERLNADKVINQVDHEFRDYTVAAVDSGFTPIKYLGLIIGLINVTAVILPESVSSKFIAKVINNEDNIGLIARTEELNLANELLDSSDVVLMDGPLISEDHDFTALSSLINKALSTNHYVLSFTKEIRINRIIDKLLNVNYPINESSLFFALFERFRHSHGSNGTLITTPVTLRAGIVGFYMQVYDGSPPIYVEASDNVLKDPGVLSSVSLMMSRENYPIPLYIADKLSKVSDELRRWFMVALLRVGGVGNFDTVLYRYIRDVLGYARGRNLY